MRQTKHYHTGFTMIELVIVIVIMAILAASVVPKFIGVSDFDAYSYRDQMISSLRLMQQKAMQQTDNSLCHQIKVESNRYGIPNVNACGTSPSFNSGWQPSTNGFVLPNSDISIISSNSATFTFNSMGIVNECDSTMCTITYTSNSNASLCIEVQGYIHAC